MWKIKMQVLKFRLHLPMKPENRSDHYEFTKNLWYRSTAFLTDVTRLSWFAFGWFINFFEVACMRWFFSLEMIHFHVYFGHQWLNFLREWILVRSFDSLKWIIYTRRDTNGTTQFHIWKKISVCKKNYKLYGKNCDRKYDYYYSTI